MPSNDPLYQSRYFKEYMKRPGIREKHLARVAARNKRIRRECQAILREFYSQGCALCPEKDPVCMSGHHLKPGSKSFHISQAHTGRVTPARLREEIKKCACICENCHRKLHAGKLKLPRVSSSIRR